MKSPWQIGLLALAVTGVSAYDFLYLKSRRSNNQASTQISETQLAAGTAEPLLSPLLQSAESSSEGSAGSLPRISREELHRLAQQAFVSKEREDAELETAWPRRDPFEAHGEPEQIPQNVLIIPVMKEASPPQPVPPPVPHCVFSGTMIEQEGTLALVDGVPLTVGDRLGIWKLARIEPDYIILEAGKATHRVELKGMGPQVAQQDNPL
jgi:hypothetical protein